MKVLGKPRLSGSHGNCCAFCEYWEGDAQIHSHGPYEVEYERDSTGHCLKGHSYRRASEPACPKFEIGYSVRKYCRM